MGRQQISVTSQVASHSFFPSKYCGVIIGTSYQGGVDNVEGISPRMGQEEFTERVKYLSRGKSLLWTLTAISQLVTSEKRKCSSSGFISGFPVTFTRIKLKGSHMRGIDWDTV